MAIAADKIPVELRGCAQWVLWKLIERDGKQTKIPFQTSDKTASTTDFQTWTTFEKAMTTYQRANSKYQGLGFVFTVDDPFVGVDIDHCIDEGEILPKAQAIIEMLNSYTERSQSGTGVHIILRAKILGDRRRKGQFEAYNSGRYFVMTGDHLDGTPDAPMERQDELNSVYEQVFAEEGKVEVSVTRERAQVIYLDDGDIISKAQSARNGGKFSQLYGGDTSDYGGDESAADLALCNILSFYTQDLEQIGSHISDEWIISR